jgi:hypothetical protein
LGAAGIPLAGAAEIKTEATVSGNDRQYWVSVMDRIARPVLTHLSRRELKKNMPVEQKPGAHRESVTHLEAFGRLLYGLAPWLAVKNLNGEELSLQHEFLGLARTSLDAATDPQSPDFMNFTNGGQPLVDAAFLAQGILRGKKVLWDPLEPRVQQQIIAVFKSSRKIVPGASNWVLFAATVESALLEFGEPTLEARLENYVRQMLGWYSGDGLYADGEFFHFDYYNSFVIHPMLVEVLGTLVKHDPKFAPAHAEVLKRAQHYAEIQERLIAPDGTFPSVGRSTTYRFGAFQTLALMVWQQELPEPLSPAQVRCALTAVIRKMIEAPGTFDANGLLPLGLPPTDEFWQAPAARWTSQKIWSGENLPADHAMKDVRAVEVPNLVRE